MSEACDSHRQKESVLLRDLPSKLEKELARRARDNGTNTAEEAADILERHARESSDRE